MPRPTESLTKQSSIAATKAAIQKTIQELIRAGYPDKQAAAIAYEEARKKTGLVI